MTVIGAKKDLGANRPDVVFASLPVSVLSQRERRLEGEAYLTGGYAIRHAIEGSGVSFDRLTSLAAVWMPGRLKGVQVTAEHGVPFYAATQLFETNPAPRKWFAAAMTPDMEQRRVPPGWILVARSGTDNVGEVMMSYTAHEGAIISDDLRDSAGKNCTKL